MLCGDLDGWDVGVWGGKGGGKEVQEGGDIRIHILIHFVDTRN